MVTPRRNQGPSLENGRLIAKALSLWCHQTWFAGESTVYTIFPAINLNLSGFSIAMFDYQRLWVIASCKNVHHIRSLGPWYKHSVANPILNHPQ